MVEDVEVKSAGMRDGGKEKRWEQSSMTVAGRIPSGGDAKV